MDKPPGNEYQIVDRGAWKEAQAFFCDKKRFEEALFGISWTLARNPRAGKQADNSDL